MGANDMSEHTPTTEQVRDGYRYDPEAEYRDPLTPHHVINGRAFDRWYAAEVRKAKAEAWDEAYQQGVDDARTADALRVDVGLGQDLYAQPGRSNPYREGDNEQR